MLDCSIWTNYPCDPEGSRKCIFVGKIATIPPVGTLIHVREDFGYEQINSVGYSVIDHSVEIIIDSVDEQNEYGPCLFKNI